MVSPTNLNDLPLFDKLGQDAIATIAGSLQRKRHAAKTILFSVDDLGESACMIEAGTVKVFIEQPGQKQVSLAILGRTALVGELSLIQSAGRSASVCTLEATTTLWFHRVAFEDWLSRFPQMGLNLAAILAQRLRLANARLFSMATEDVEGQVVRIIIAFAQEYGQEQSDGSWLVPLRITQGDLAELTGAARGTVNGAVTALRKARMLSIDSRKYLTIHDLPALIRRWG